MIPAYSQQRMPDLQLLDSLRERGVSRATFHPDGSIASVEFGPIASDSDEPQHEAPKGPPKRMSATGGLVPRVGDSQ